MNMDVMHLEDLMLVIILMNLLVLNVNIGDTLQKSSSSNGMIGI